MMSAISRTEDSLRALETLRETVALVIRLPVLFLLIPWLLVGVSSATLEAVAHFGVFRWLFPLYLAYAGGYDAYVLTHLIHLAFAIAATSCIVVLVDEAGIDRLRTGKVTAGTALRRTLEVGALAALIAVPVLALAADSLLLPASLLLAGGNKPLLSLLVLAGAASLACGLSWLLATQAVALPVAVIEGAGMGSLRRSWQLTRGFRWRISALIGPLVALVAVLFLYMAEAVAPPANMFDQFPPPITALDRVIDIAGRSFTLGAGLGIAMVMTTLIYRRLVEIKGR